MTEQSKIPTRKIGAVGIAGALTTIIITISRDALHYEMTPDLAAAITTVVTFLSGYFTANKVSDA